MSDLVENDPGWAIHLVLDSSWESLGEQYEKLMKMSDSLRGTEYII